MAFIRIESLNEPSLAAVHKCQNRVSEYAELFGKLKQRGILVFAGLMVGLEEDTSDYYRRLPEMLRQVDPSAVLTSIAIPIPGTPLFEKLSGKKRIVDTDLAHYEGDHLVFRPRHLSATELATAYAAVCREFYSCCAIVGRWLRLVAAQWRGGTALERLFRTLVLTAVYLRLTLFQRHHTRSKVLGARRVGTP
jgi:radical SAM superfamily enzyme YgiQ (UPF0313 family)